MKPGVHNWYRYLRKYIALCIEKHIFGVIDLNKIQPLDSVPWLTPPLHLFLSTAVSPILIILFKG